MSSIRRQLLVGLLALVATVDGLAGFLSYRNTLHSTGELLDYQLRQMALSLRDQGAAASQVRIPAQGQAFDFAIQIWNNNGTTLYASRPSLPIASTVRRGYADLTVDEEPWRVFALQTPQRMILVGQPWRVREELAGRTALRATAPLLILTPLLAIAIWWTVARTLAPIKRIVGEVQNRDADSLSPLVNSALPDEIEPLTSELNRLLERLAAAFDAQRGFITNAAHELRSPLTALHIQLQLLRRATDEETRSQALDRLTAAIERAASLVQQLLTLARSEAGTTRSAHGPVHLDVIVRESLAESASLAISRGTDLALEAEGTVEVIGDGPSLRVLVRNLVDNALRYTPPKGCVRVSLYTNDETATLEIEDSGPGIAPEERERVFERFYRGVGAPEGGSGLGLAIVKAIADRHQAAVTLSDARLGGLRATVTLARAVRAPTAGN